MKEIKSNLRWAGGKSKMIKILDTFMPDSVDKYLELFTGGYIWRYANKNNKRKEIKNE